MVIGFTGTRNGLSEPQRAALLTLLNRLNPMEVHHGDCIGSYADFHELVKMHLPNAIVVVHPPKQAKFRANVSGNICLEPLDYLQRNHQIVDVSDCMIATPREHEEQRRSGTWATVRYAAKQDKPIYIVWPNEEVALMKQDGNLTVPMHE